MGNKKKQLSDDTLIVAYRLREARSKKFRTIREAAESFPAMKTLWSHWENAYVRPNGATIEKLADFFGVPVDFFRQRPENWESERRLFLAELLGRTNTSAKKDYYNAFKTTLQNAHDEGRTPTAVGSKPGGGDALSIFLQITRLISDAQNKVMQGEIEQEAYYAHMQMIADMVKVILFTRK